MSLEISVPGSICELGYRIGPLLYTPGLRTDIAEKIAEYSRLGLKSAAVCLEDTVRDDLVEAAEKNAAWEIKRFAREYPDSDVNIFIRVRKPSQIGSLADIPGLAGIIKGFIIPKIDDITIRDYMAAADTVRGAGLCLMPILENPSLLDICGREKRLGSLRESLLSMSDCIANVRLGGNDLCSGLGIVSPVSRTIYDIPPIAGLLSDIAAALTPHFIVSAPVWNYFGGDKGGAWRAGMERELETDRLMGFVGKTIIHPCQIAPAMEAMKVSRQDYSDALAVVASKDNEIQVIKGGSSDGSRMLEAKVHMKWAEKILRLGKIYGIKGEGQ